MDIGFERAGIEVVFADSEFWNISREERKYCLTVDSRYKLYATLKPATLIRRDWNCRNNHSQQPEGYCL